MWTYSPQKRQAGSAFALMYRLLLRSCTLMGVFVISPVPSFLSESLPSSRAPLLHGYYAASQLLLAPPPPSRLPPFSWFGQLYGFLAPPSFLAGRGGLLQSLDMSLIGIERGRASRRWRVSILALSVCKVGSQFHLNHVRVE